MDRSAITKILMKHNFWLSILLHLLFFLLMLLVLKPKPQEKKVPTQYQVPTYVYKGAITPSFQRNNSQSLQTSTRSAQSRRSTLPNPAHAQQHKPAHVNAKAIAIAKHEARVQPSLMASSLQMLRNNQLERIATHQTVDEPILLIGDEHEIADPFITLIGRALSAHFKYPELEGRMGVKGRVLVAMTLYPEGNFDDVEIVQSSNNQHLDAAALFAVNKAPLVEQASRFIKKPKRFVVGFVFL